MQKIEIASKAAQAAREIVLRRAADQAEMGRKSLKNRGIGSSDDRVIGALTRATLPGNPEAVNNLEISLFSAPPRLRASALNALRFGVQITRSPDHPITRFSLPRVSCFLVCLLVLCSHA